MICFHSSVVKLLPMNKKQRNARLNKQIRNKQSLNERSKKTMDTQINKRNRQTIDQSINQPTLLSRGFRLNGVLNLEILRQ